METEKKEQPKESHQKKEIVDKREKDTNGWNKKK